LSFTTAVVEDYSSTFEMRLEGLWSSDSFHRVWFESERLLFIREAN
jgi:hypothetical protein